VPVELPQPKMIISLLRSPSSPSSSPSPLLSPSPRAPCCASPLFPCLERSRVNKYTVNSAIALPIIIVDTDFGGIAYCHDTGLLPQLHYQRPTYYEIERKRPNRNKRHLILDYGHCAQAFHTGTIKTSERTQNLTLKTTHRRKKAYFAGICTNSGSN